MVNTKIEMITIVGNTQATSSFGIRILQSLPDYPMGVRNGRIVEITANQHKRRTVPGDKSGYRIGLYSSDFYGICQFVEQQFPSFFHIFLIWRLQQMVINFLVFAIQFIRLQMVIDNKQRIVFYFQPIKHTSIIQAFIRNTFG